MTRLPALKPRDVLSALERFGFAVDHITGSHYILRHPDGKRVTIPFHGNRDIKRGVVRSILKQSGLTAEQFLRLL